MPISHAFNKSYMAMQFDADTCMGELQKMTVDVMLEIKRKSFQRLNTFQTDNKNSKFHM